MRTAAAVLVLLMLTSARAAESEALAIKLVAMGTFVRENCHGLEPNIVMMNAALEAMGVPLKDLTKQNRLLQGNLIVLALKKDVKGNCKQAVELFGPDGRVLPGMIDKQ